MTDRRAIDGKSVDTDLVKPYLGEIGGHRLLSRATNSGWER